MTLTVRNITELDHVVSTLVIGGYSDSEIQELIKPFTGDTGAAACQVFVADETIFDDQKKTEEKTFINNTRISAGNNVINS